MKKVLLALVALLLLGMAQETMAQQKKKAPIRRTTTARTTTAKVSKPIVKTIAAYKTNVRGLDIGITTGDIAIDNKYIYYVEAGENNSVIGINQETGLVETIIPGIAGIYEGARPEIRRVSVSSGKLFLRTYTRKDGRKFWLYDGKSLETSQQLPTWRAILKMTQNRALICSTKDQVELWDTQNMKKIVSFDFNFWYSIGMPSLNSYLDTDKDNPALAIASDDAIWSIKNEYPDGDVIRRLDKNGHKSTFQINKEDYVINNALNNNFSYIFYKGDFLYACKERRVYRMNMLSPGKWEEYAKIPANENKTFEVAVPDSKGNLFTWGKTSFDYNIEYYKANNLNTPTALGSYNLPTGLDNLTKIWLSNCRVWSDNNDNFVIYVGKVIYIYNPNGVVGYTKNIGKVME